MAAETVPLSIAQRHKLLFTAPAPAAELRRWGDLHRDKGLLHDALEFYAGAKAADAIGTLAERAVAEADLVLYLNACRALGRDPDRAVLGRLKETAARLGKESVAQKVDLLIVT